ncbi:MAG: hypothetical protein NTZ13_03110 [Candidatus Parcubacteria bacterium]|nr:hypothetical protein [Candidatus Parcubacteria bacterium]
MKTKFFALLEKVQSYPDEKKRLIGFAVSGALTFFIVSANFVIPGTETKVVVAEPNRNIASPFSMLSLQFSQSLSQMKNGFPLKEEVGALISHITKKATTTESI